MNPTRAWPGLRDRSDRARVTAVIVAPEDAAGFQLPAPAHVRPGDEHASIAERGPALGPRSSIQDCEFAVGRALRPVIGRDPSELPPSTPHDARR